MSDKTYVISTETGLEALERLVPRPHVTSLSPLLAQVRLEAREVIQVTSSTAGVLCALNSVLLSNFNLFLSITLYTLL